jgi:hypothetical protein
MRYADLEQNWMDAHSTKLPTRYASIDAPFRAPWITDARSAQMYENSISPFDLFLRPNAAPSLSAGGYSSSAMNMQDDSIGRNQTAMITKAPRLGMYSTLFPIQFTRPQYGDIPKDKQKFIPQVQFEHEYVHSTRYGLIGDNPQYNHGNVNSIHGMRPSVWREEVRAMGGEDRFWDLVKQGIIK